MQHLEEKSDFMQDYITQNNSSSPEDLEMSAFHSFLCPARI